MENHQLVNQSSLNVEYYTPLPILEATRQVLGTIDLDPASSVKANEWVLAKNIITKEQNGLDPFRFWYGKVWMNHPFGRRTYPPHPRFQELRTTAGYKISPQYLPGNEDWINKLVLEYTAGRVSEALCITYAATSEKWFYPLLLRPQCYLSPRTNYMLPNGKKKAGVTKGSVVTYFGHNLVRFAQVFSKLGVIKLALVM